MSARPRATGPNRARAWILVGITGIAIALAAVLGIRLAMPMPTASAAELAALQEQQVALDKARAAVGSVSEKHQAMYKRIEREVEHKKEVMATARSTWSRNASLALLALAAVMTAVSFIKPGSWRVASTGALLSGTLIAAYAAYVSFAGASMAVRIAACVVALGGLALFVAVAPRRLAQSPGAAEVAA